MVTGYFFYDEKALIGLIQFINVQHKLKSYVHQIYEGQLSFHIILMVTN